MSQHELALKALSKRLSDTVKCPGQGCISGKVYSREYDKYLKVAKVLKDTEPAGHDDPRVVRWKEHERKDSLFRLQIPVEIALKMTEPADQWTLCPSCRGTGKIKVLLTGVELQNAVRDIVNYLVEGESPAVGEVH